MSTHKLDIAPAYAVNAARARLLKLQGMSANVERAYISTLLKVASRLPKPADGLNKIDLQDSNLGYRQDCSSMLIGFVAHKELNIHRKLKVKGVKIPVNFGKMNTILTFMEKVTQAGGPDACIIGCEMGYFNCEKELTGPADSHLKYPYINIRKKGPRMYWAFDENNSFQFKMRVKSAPGNATYGRDLRLYVGKLTPKTCISMQDPLSLPFGMVLQGRVRDEPNKFESIMEIVLVPNNVASIHVDWSIPPVIRPKWDDLKQTATGVRLKTAIHKFPSSFVTSIFNDDAIYGDAMAFPIPLINSTNKSNTYMPNEENTLDIIQLAANHTVEFLWKATLLQFKIQAYKHIVNVMVLELFKLQTPPPARAMQEDDEEDPTEKLSDIFNSYIRFCDADLDYGMMTSMEKKNFLFMSVSALLHEVKGLFPFSHGLSKTLDFQQELLLLVTLKKYVIFLNGMKQKLHGTTDDIKLQPDAYLKLFQHIDESILSAMKDPCGRLYALNDEMRNLRHWSSNIPSIYELLKKDMCDPCAVWSLTLPLKIKPLHIIGCVGILRDYIPWAFQAVRDLLPYVKPLYDGKLSMSVDQLDARVKQRRIERNEDPPAIDEGQPTLRSTAYIELYIENHTRNLYFAGVRQQHKPFVFVNTNLQLDLNRNRGGAYKGHGMGDNITRSEQTLQMIDRAISRSSRSVSANPKRMPAFDFSPYCFHGFLNKGISTDVKGAMRGDTFHSSWGIDASLDNMSKITTYMAETLCKDVIYGPYIRYYEDQYDALLLHEAACEDIHTRLYSRANNLISNMIEVVGFSLAPVTRLWFDQYEEYLNECTRKTCSNINDDGGIMDPPLPTYHNTIPELIAQYISDQPWGGEQIDDPDTQFPMRLLKPYAFEFHYSATSFRDIIDASDTQRRDSTFLFLFALFITSKTHAGSNYSALFQSFSYNENMAAFENALYIIRFAVQFFRACYPNDSSVTFIRNQLKERLFAPYNNMCVGLQRTISPLRYADGMSYKCFICELGGLPIPSTTLGQSMAEVTAEFKREEPVRSANERHAFRLEYTIKYLSASDSKYAASFDAMINAGDLLEYDTEKLKFEECLLIQSEAEHALFGADRKRKQPEGSPIQTYGYISDTVFNEADARGSYIVPPSSEHGAPRARRGDSSQGYQEPSPPPADYSTNPGMVVEDGSEPQGSPPPHRAPPRSNWRGSGLWDPPRDH